MNPTDMSDMLVSVVVGVALGQLAALACLLGVLYYWWKRGEL